MDLGLRDKSALVLASSKGLGRAIATALAAEGARVMVSGREEATLERTAADIRETTGAEVAHHVADLTRAGDVESLVGATAEAFGGIDVLVTNTGGPPAGGFEDFADEDWTAAFELTLLSMIRAIRATLPHMRAQGAGRIVCVASSSIKQPIDNLTLSNTFRAGIAGLAKSLSAELAPDGILINTLGPGRIATDRTAGMDAARAEKTRLIRRGSPSRVRGAHPARTLRHTCGVRRSRRVSGFSGQQLPYRTVPAGGRRDGAGTLATPFASL